MNRIALVLSLLACHQAAGFAGETERAAPEWVKRNDFTDGRGVHSKGMGAMRVDALAQALAALAKQTQTEVGRSRTREYPASSEEKNAPAKDAAAYDTTTKSFAAADFGKVHVTALSKEYLLRDGGGDDLSENVKVVMTSGDRAYSIKLFLESTSTPASKTGDAESSLQIVGKNLEFADLLDELKRAGMNVEFYEDGKDSYAGVSWAPKKP